jgi:hypothetical protein
MPSMLRKPLLFLGEIVREALVSIFDDRKDQVIEKIIRFVQSIDIAPIWDNWFAGVTEDPSRQLYVEHRAAASKSIVVPVDSAFTARAIEAYLIGHHGMDGAMGSGGNPQYVYVFKKTHDTDPYL